MRLSAFQKLLLGIALLSAVGAAAILSAGLRRRAMPVLGPSCRLPDGSTLSVMRAEWGATHCYPFRPSWVRRKLSRAFPQRFPLPQNRSRWETGDGIHPFLGVWLARDGVPAGSALEPSTLIAYDSHGCPFPVQTPFSGIPLGPQAGPGGVLFASLPQFPRHEASFRLEVRDRSGKVVGQVAVDHGMASPSLARLWRPSLLPITRRAGDVSVTLADVRTWTSRGIYPHMKMDLAFRFHQAGQPTDDWEPALERMVLSDAAGSVQRFEHLWAKPQQERVPLWICPYQPAWKLEVPVFPAAAAPAPAGERWQVRDVPVPKRGQAVALGKTGAAGSAVLEAWAVAGPGVYEYRSGVPKALDPVPAKWRRMAARNVVVAVPPGKAGGRWTTVGSTVHVAGSWRGIPEGRRLTLRVTDERGRLCGVNGPCPFSGAECFCFGIHVPPGAKRLNLEFAVRRGREVEFVFAPPPPGKLP